MLAHCPNATVEEPGPGQSWGPGTASGSSTWEAEPQMLEPSCATFKDPVSEAEQPECEPGTLARDAGIPGGNLTL